MSKRRKPPKRFKAIEDLTADEHAQRQTAQRRGDPVPEFETDAYRQARREALEAAGLEHDDDTPTAIEDMTPEDHFNRMRRTR